MGLYLILELGGVVEPRASHMLSVHCIMSCALRLWAEAFPIQIVILYQLLTSFSVWKFLTSFHGEH